MKNLVIEKLRLINLKRLLKQKQSSAKSPQMPLIQVGQVSIPNCLENQGLLCVGSSRDRLNTSINLVRQLKRRTDFRGVVLDPGGELLERFFDPALDTIFALNDKRSVAWCHKAEPLSGREFARSLIDVNPADPFFYQAAINVLGGIFDSSDTSDQVWQKLNVLVPQDLQIYFPNNDTLAAEMLREPICAASVMSIIKNATRFYRYLEGNSTFSFYDWGSNDNPGWVFILWYEGNKEDEQLMPVRQMLIELVLQGLLSRKEVAYHKSAIIIPDCQSLRINSLVQFIMRSRDSQCKGFPWLGIAPPSSVAGYSRQNIQFLVDSMPNRLIFAPTSDQSNTSPKQVYLEMERYLVKVQIPDELANAY